jgi:RNA polymerase sigma-70 factor (ECF subfamily)
MRKFLASRGATKVADFDDVSQEVFLRLLRYESEEVIENPQAYVLKIAANVVAEWALRSRHRMAHEPQWLAAIAVEDRLGEGIDSGAAQQEIHRALGTLPARERRILKLHFEEGLSYSRIAERLEISERVVRRDFEKSYSKLRREINVEITGALIHGAD